MTPALARTRALLDTPTPDPIPGQLDLEHHVTTSLPCTGRTALYDAALYSDDVPSALHAQAVRQAAALCATCPSPCDQKVTADTSRTKAPTVSGCSDIRRPEERVAAWAHMAAERAASGQSLSAIAVDLWVDEATAAALITQAQTLGRAA